MADTYSMPLRAVADLHPDPKNARKHSDEQLRSLRSGIEEFGWTYPIAADAAGIVRAGNGRLAIAQAIYVEGGRIKLPSGDELPDGMIPALDCSGWTDQQWAAYALFDNKIADDAEWDQQALADALRELDALDIDTELSGFSQGEFDAVIAGLDAAAKSAEGKAQAKASSGTLAREFLIPPFTVLNAREGWWQERKRQWLALGIESEVGRGDNLLKFSDTLIEPDPEKRKAMKDAKNAPGDVPGGLAYGSMQISDGANRTLTGTSIFDPVMCEIAYRWFSPRGGLILDPFAGGSVRGIVAAALGRKYRGIDLREEQVEANDVQWGEIEPRLPDIEGEDHPGPEWYAGDSNEVLGSAPFNGKADADLIFTCPPYGDLEVYSDIATDLSAMGADEFDAVYAEIIAKAAKRLKPNRFAAIVIGDYRDKDGLYRNFVSKTIAAFEAAGLRLYNEAILVTATGSLAIRAGGSFRTTRKMGKTHQNFLIFVKGDPRKAADDLGPVDVSAALANLGENQEDGDGIISEDTEYGEKISGLGGEI